MFAVFLVLGFVVCFFGRKLYRPIFFLAGLLLAMGIIILIFYTTFLTSNTSSAVGWGVLAGSFVVGLIVGYIFMKISKLGAFVLAGWGGFALGLLLWNTFLYYTGANQAIFWTFCIGLALVFGILALVFFDPIIISATAIAGGYVFIYGIGLVAGGF